MCEVREGGRYDEGLGDAVYTGSPIHYNSEWCTFKLHTSVSYSSTLSMVATASTILYCGEDGCGPSGVAAVPLLERYRTGQKRTATGGLRPDGSANRGELLSGMMSVDDSVGEPARYS